MTADSFDGPLLAVHSKGLHWAAMYLNGPAYAVDQAELRHQWQVFWSHIKNASLSTLT